MIQFEGLEKIPEWSELTPNYPREGILSAEEFGIENIQRIYDLLCGNDDFSVEVKLDEGLSIRKVGEGQSGKVFAVTTPTGTIAVKVELMRGPRPAFVHQDKHVVVGHTDSTGEYFFYSDLRHFLTLPGPGKEITFMEYGSDTTLEGKPQYFLHKQYKRKQVLDYMQKSGYKTREQNTTHVELDQNHNYLLLGKGVRSEVVAIDIPFWRPNEEYRATMKKISGE